jgi:NACalpha-BTF3-like transcription factor
MTKSIFDHVSAIYSDQNPEYFDKLNDVDKKTVQTFMINRIISMNVDQVELVNELQKYGLTEPKTTYLFYSNILPKRKQYNKYIKGAKDEKYAEELVTLVSTHFGVSKSEAIDALEIYYHTDEGKVELKQICESYGWDQKSIRKVKI